MSDNKKNKRKRRVLAASCILAALIVAGSSFAWFTSQDEVVNKLSAQNGYNVVAVEDFTPPKNWTPGQEVEKKVGATNTGNVDAFVKASLSGSLDLTTKDTGTDTVPTASSLTDAAKAKYVILNSTNNDEVKSLQAGGRLVAAPVGDDAPDTAVILATEEQTILGTGFNPKTTQITLNDNIKQTNKTGLYIFKRTDDTLVGYFYDAIGEKYYALDTITPDQETNPTKYTAKYQQTKTDIINNDKFEYSYDSDKKVIKATYAGTNTATDAEGQKDDIIINIKLSTNTEAAKEQTVSGDKWFLPIKEDGSLDLDTNTVPFYYAQILKAGKTSANFIDSVTLDSTVQKEAYIALDYNLKVTVDSAQVVDDRTTSGTAVTAVNAQTWSTYDATYTADNSVTWAKSTSTP
ncbi:MAG: BsaA family SipW-dependent biofilm matrix protein [Clostridia bacterium]|nr:BsaA family SipW-dependent biofilm matrix protein [Clostridia bacterium]